MWRPSYISQVMTTNLISKDPDMQPLLEGLLVAGFTRTYRRESRDPREVSSLTIKDGPVVVVVDLVKRSMTVRVFGRSDESELSADPFEALTQVREHLFSVADSTEGAEPDPGASAAKEIVSSYPYQLN